MNYSTISLHKIISYNITFSVYIYNYGIGPIPMVSIDV